MTFKLFSFPISALPAYLIKPILETRRAHLIRYLDCYRTPVGQTRDYKIGICCSSAKQAVLRGKIKDWLARKKNNVSKWSDLSNSELLFQWDGTNNFQQSVLVKYKADIIIIPAKYTLFSQ